MVPNLTTKGCPVFSKCSTPWLFPPVPSQFLLPQAIPPQVKQSHKLSLISQPESDFSQDHPSEAIFIPALICFKFSACYKILIKNSKLDLALILVLSMQICLVSFLHQLNFEFLHMQEKPSLAVRCLAKERLDSQDPNR
jgi:hypothetical protein